MTRPIYRYWDDGKTHINVYSRGMTEIGRLLSNFAHTPVQIPNDGLFQSIEGYWYWLDTHDDALRRLVGFKAKQYGRSVRGTYPITPWAKKQEKIKIALHCKIQQHPRILKLLKATTLPLAHYYVKNGKEQDRTAESQWMLDVFDEYRNEE